MVGSILISSGRRRKRSHVRNMVALHPFKYNNRQILTASIWYIYTSLLLKHYTHIWLSHINIWPMQWNVFTPIITTAAKSQASIISFPFLDGDVCPLHCIHPVWYHDIIRHLSPIFIKNSDRRTSVIVNELGLLLADVMLQKGLSFAPPVSVFVFDYGWNKKSFGIPSILSSHPSQNTLFLPAAQCRSRPQYELIYENLTKSSSCG